MPETWVTSDTHWGHANILWMARRPFISAADMDELRALRENSQQLPKHCDLRDRLEAGLLEMNHALVERWNKVVKPEDTVIHLGDVFFRDGWQYLPLLNGKKKLILGNHDHLGRGIIEKHFVSIDIWRKIGNVVFTHVPVHESTFEFSGISSNVHGHIHQNVVTRDVLNPVSLDYEEEPDLRYRCVSVEHTDYTPINIQELL